MGEHKMMKEGMIPLRRSGTNFYHVIISLDTWTDYTISIIPYL